MSVESQWTNYNCRQYGDRIGLTSPQVLAARFACSDVEMGAAAEVTAESPELSAAARQAGEALVLHFPEEQAEQAEEQVA